jgi:hypothetical protein
MLAQRTCNRDTGKRSVQPPPGQNKPGRVHNNPRAQGSMFRFAFFLALIAASIANAQAGAPMPTPVRPPLVRPVVNEPYFPTPGATPAGAGIVVPTREGGEQVVPRSPNKRILPATKEAGLWAADGAPRAVVLDEIPQIQGISLPFAPSATTDDEKYLTRYCAYRMNAVFWYLELTQRASSLPPDVRACLVGKLYEHCARVARESYEEQERSGNVFHAGAKARIRETGRAAQAFREAKCKGVPSSADADDIESGVVGIYQNRDIHL